MYRVVLHSALLVQLYSHIVHDVCVGLPWFDGHIVFALVDLCFWRECATRLVSFLDLWLSLAARMALVRYVCCA